MNGISRGTAITIVALGLFVGYVTIRGLWPNVLLSLFYPRDVEVIA